MIVDHITVEPGDGWWTIARRLAPDVGDAQIYLFVADLKAANGYWLDEMLHPGRILVFDPAKIPLPPPPPPPQGTWEEAWATDDPAVIEAWFVDNTGHDDTLTMTEEGALTIDAPGTYEAIHCTNVIVNAVDVTLRHCHIDGSGINAYGVTGTGLHVVLDHCTIDGGGTERKGVIFDVALDPDDVTVTYCDISGYGTGLYTLGGLTAQYCWVHDLHYWAGSHNTSASIRERNTSLWRCCFTDGNSSAVSFYAETSPYTAVELVESLLRTSNAHYEVNFPNDKPYHTPAPGETRRLIGNLMERGAVSDLANFTEVSGNRRFDGTPVGGS